MAARPVTRMAARPAALACALALTLAAGCGESEQAKAEKTVCEARAKISTTVQKLQSTTAQSVSLSSLEADLATLTENLGKIRGAQSALSAPRKEQVERANQAFTTELATLTRELANLSPNQVQAQVKGAVEKLAASYRQALAPIPC